MPLAAEAEVPLVIEGHGVDELRNVGVGRLEVERLACGIADGTFGGELIATMRASTESEEAEERKREEAERLHIHCLPCGCVGCEDIREKREPIRSLWREASPRHVPPRRRARHVWQP